MKRIFNIPNWFLSHLKKLQVNFIKDLEYFVIA